MFSLIKKNFVFIFVSLALFNSFFAGGNNHSILIITLILLSCLCLIIHSYSRDNIKLFELSLIMILCYLVFQIIPLPKPLWEFLSSQTVKINEMINPTVYWFSISLNFFHSFKYIVTWSIVVLIFLFIPFYVVRKKELELFINCIIFIGFIHVFFGLVVLILEISEIGPYQKIFYLNSNTGFFINRNNFCLFLIMIFHLTFYQLNYYKKKEFKLSYQNQFYRFLFSNFLILRFILFFIVVGIILTKSRVGNLAFGCSLLTYVALDIYKNKQFSFISKTIFLILIIDVLFLSQYFGSEKLVERYLASTFEGEQTRFDVFSFAINTFLNFPIFGYGIGNFENIFRIFYGVHDHFYDHVHNDYIEFVGELGIIGFLLILLMIFSYIKFLKDRFQYRTLSLENKGLLITVTLSLAIHSLFDFALHMPANIILAALVYASILIKPIKIRGSSRLEDLR